MKHICVFLSANELSETYKAAAREFAAQLAENDMDLVYGGSEMGLMKVLADAVHEQGRRVIGVSTEFLKSSQRSHADELIMTADLSERKKVMAERSDACVVFPGGLGTLDEVSDLFELKKHNFYQKPIVVFNMNGFYDGLAQQLRRMEEEGFLKKPAAEYVTFAASIDEIFQTLTSAS